MIDRWSDRIDEKKDGCRVGRAVQGISTMQKPVIKIDKSHFRLSFPPRSNFRVNLGAERDPSRE